jgi:hypothetical protein
MFLTFSTALSAPKAEKPSGIQVAVALLQAAGIATLVALAILSYCKPEVQTALGCCRADLFVTAALILVHLDLIISLVGFQCAKTSEKNALSTTRPLV